MLSPYKISIIIILILNAVHNIAQPLPILKTFEKPVLMHYMPWFETPEFEGFWGWHWKMNNQNPNNIVDPDTGKREIASHFYPLIGPYSSKDPDVIEYHLLLMKFSGIDGILIDWYGIEGSNGDINSLLESSNAIIDKVDEVGLDFGIIMEDRFSESVEDVKANLEYADNNYFNNDKYFRFGDVEDPLFGLFGPINFETENDWDEIIPSASEDIELLTLWYEGNDCGTHTDGEYVWIYEDENLDDYYSRLVNFYDNRAPNLNTVMGVAYCGFEDFYFEGNAGNGFFTINHNNGQVLDSTLNLTSQYEEDIDILQLATWNDFGEGTMFEPTFEFGFDFLVQLQDFLGIPYGEEVFEQIHRLYSLRKEYADDNDVQLLLDEVFESFVSLEIMQAKNIMDEIELSTNIENEEVLIDNYFKMYPNPISDYLYIKNHLPDHAKIKIFNLQGQEIYPPILKDKIDFSDFLAGIYFLQIKLAHHSIHKKIILAQ